MADLDTLIATFPSQLQNNALRAAQTGVEQQNLIQNALTMRQNQQGQNALSQIYSNQNNIDSGSGLPNIRALAPLAQVNPDMYMSMVSSLGRIQDANSRSNLTNFKFNEEVNKVLNDNVAVPVIERDLELQRQGIDPQQRKIMTEQYRKELVDKTKAGYGLPDYATEAFSAIPVSDLAARSEIVQQRQEAITKGREERVDVLPDGTRVPYEYNKYTGYNTRNGDIYTPQNPYKMGTESGKPPAELKPLPAPQMATVTKDDGSKEQRGVYRYPDGTIRDANTNEVLDSSKVNIAKPGSEMSDPAQAYMAERERLGLHMTAAWATSQYLPQMAEADIKASLNLPQDASVTVQDARAAAINDVATQRGMHADSQALTTVARQNALVQSFEGTAQREANLVEQLGPKGVAGGDMLWNRFRQASRREIGIDPDLGKLDSALTSLKNEYVKIMSTSAGQGGLTSDAAREEGNRLFNINQPWDVLQGQLQVARQSMSNRVGSIRSDYNSTLDAIRNKGVFAEPSPLAPGEGTLKSPGAVPGAVPSASSSNRAAIPAQKFNTLDDAISRAPIGQVYNWNGTVFYKEPGGKVRRYVNGAWQ